MKRLKSFYTDDSGQALVEYLLLTAVLIGVLVSLKNSIRTVTIRLWGMLGKRIASPCHDLRACEPGPEFDL